MTDFGTLNVKYLNKLSQEEIKQFAIHLKVRFGEQAVQTADYLALSHEHAGDFERANMWRTVSSSLKINQVAPSGLANKVNTQH